MSKIALIRPLHQASLRALRPPRCLSSAPLPRRIMTRSISSSRSAGGSSNTKSAKSQSAGAFQGGLIVSALVIWALSSTSIRNEEALDDPAPSADQASGHGLIPYSEVQKHNSKEDCWVIIDGRIYDLTEFANNHPGGAGPIHRAAGHDATAIYAPLHPPGTIENGLEEEQFIGLVDPATMPQVVSKAASGEGDKERRIELGEIIGLPDFDAAAKINLTSKAWAYMSSGATDQYTLNLNRTAFNSILFRPRIMVNVDEVDTRTQMMGQDTSLPIFISPAGMAKLSHPEGEALLAKGAGQCDIIQMISTNASAPLDTIIGSRTRPDQPFFMQLYVDRNRPKSEALLKKVEGMGLKAVFVTVDAAAPGKREADERCRAEVEVASGISGGKISSDSKGGGIGRSVGGFIDPKLSWDDIAWMRKHTSLPIGCKGIQTAEDAVRAMELGVDAIYLSNHGGRALDGAAPALYTLMEMNKLCPEVFKKCEVYIDGGCRRGTDVVKALCLGAKGVGMGRPFLYSLTYGEEGVVHAIEIMRDEIQTTMRLLGVTKLSQLGPHLLNTKAVDPLLADSLSYGPHEKQ